MRETVNMRVTQAGYKYVGHYRRGHLEIVLEGGGLGGSITPKNEFDLFDLFLCFGIDPEDGKWMNDIVGKYCRVQLYDDGKLKMIKHIVNDEIWWCDGKSEYGGIFRGS